MSYRTCINGTQIFGNNESYPEWIDFIKSKGIEIDEDGIYDAYIDDLQGMFNVIDKITRRLINERHEEVLKGEKDWEGEPYSELTDLSKSMWLEGNVPLLTYNMQMINRAYCFLPYQAYKAVEDIIERSDTPYISEDGREWFCCTFKLKEGKKIHVGAYWRGQMKITEKTKEYECCCSCKHNKRKSDEKGIYCECEIDGHYIDYIQSFDNVCERWAKE